MTTSLSEEYNFCLLCILQIRNAQIQFGLRLRFKKRRGSYIFRRWRYKPPQLRKNHQFPVCCCLVHLSPCYLLWNFFSYYCGAAKCVLFPRTAQFWLFVQSIDILVYICEIIWYTSARAQTLDLVGSKRSGQRSNSPIPLWPDFSIGLCKISYMGDHH